jgi:hypothetical protein
VSSSAPPSGAVSAAGADRGRAATAAGAADARLRGRTYAIPFDTVWQAACTLAGGRLARWRIRHADDHSGVILADAAARIGAGHDVVIRIGLDHDAQTRVDAAVTARKPGTDFGRAARRLHQFFVALDRSLAHGSGPARR